MNFNKILQNTDYSTKQVLGYYILAFREVNNNGDNQRIEEYVKSIVNQIESIDVKDTLKNIDINIKGRHDPVIIPRAVVVTEAMAAITIGDLLFANMFSKIENIKYLYKR